MRRRKLFSSSSSQSQVRTSSSTYQRLARWYDLLSLPERPLGRRALTLLALQPGERVLVVGSGTGRHLTEAAREGASVIGVDLAPAMCRQANERLHQARLAQPAQVLCADALQLPLTRASCDAALMAFTLELFSPSDMARALGGIAKVLRPEGRLVVACLSRRQVTPMVRLYERAHSLWPRQIDCRPILAVPLLRNEGWRVIRVIEATLCGLPVDIALAAPPLRSGDAG